MRSPVLLLIFNRPATSEQVFAAVRRARPPRLYVAADGPRDGRRGELSQCEAARRVATAVDWPCQVRTLFRDKNLGCKFAVSSAISWFFESEAEGVILEDDILPEETFFEYCDELLVRYRSDPRVAMVSGCNVVGDRSFTPCSYLFSRYAQIWGWASWRRAWRYYDVSMPGWPAWRDAGELARVSDGNAFFEFFWRQKLNSTYAGLENTWDYQWTFACWQAGGLTVLPGVNQVQNLGTGADATHSFSGTQFLAGVPTLPLRFPLTHPESVAHSSVADSAIGAKVFATDVSSFLRRAPRRAFAAWGNRRRHAG